MNRFLILYLDTILCLGSTKCPDISVLNSVKVWVSFYIHNSPYGQIKVSLLFCYPHRIMRETKNYHLSFTDVVVSAPNFYVFKLLYRLKSIWSRLVLIITGCIVDQGQKIPFQSLGCFSNYPMMSIVCD